MALPASTTFSGKAEPVEDGENFDPNMGAMYKSGGNAGGNSAGEIGYGWNADTFANDQLAYAEMADVGTSFWMGVAVRVAADGTSDDFYQFYADDSSSYLGKIVSGSWTQLGSTGAGFATGEVIRLEVEDTTLTPEKDDVELDPPGAQTDSAHASGRAGITASGAGWEITNVTNWTGDDISVAGVTLPDVVMSPRIAP